MLWLVSTTIRRPGWPFETGGALRTGELVGRHDAELPDAESNQSSTATSRGLAHRIPLLHVLLREGTWSRADTLAALTLVAAVVALVVGVLQLDVARGVPQKANLVLDKVEVARTSDIDATSQDGASSSVATKVVGSVVDITLRNKGTAPALVVSADLAFKTATELENCSGAGPGVVTAQYDVRVPVDPAVTGHPFASRRDMRFVVRPNSIDRLQLSVGPESYGLSSWPWVYQFDLTLHEDNGQSLSAGTIGLLGLPGQSWNKFGGLSSQTMNPGTFACVAHDASLLSQAMVSPGLHSPELETLYNEAVSATANAGSCASTGPSGNACYTTRGKYFSDERGVTSCSPTVEIVQSYGCQVAPDVIAAFGQGGPRSASVTVSSGFLVLPMACAPAGSAEVCRSTDNQNLVVGFVP
jgi:hypothetical protein